MSPLQRLKPRVGQI